MLKQGYDIVPISLVKLASQNAIQAFLIESLERYSIRAALSLLSLA